MKELTIGQIQKVVAFYVGQKVTGHHTSRMETTHIQSTIYYSSITGLAERIADGRGKLILKSLFAISDEDAKAVAILIWPLNVFHRVAGTDAYYGRTAIFFHVLHCSWDNESGYDTAKSRTDIATGCPPEQMALAFQYLISKGYSVPLYVLDGQDPLTANLAITPEQVNKIQA